MLFVGGRPLTADAFCSVLRVPPAVFHAAVDTLNRKYKAQNRPYSVLPRDGGYTLAVKPQYRSLRERLYGGPREARLTQPALDVLALVAYRQPVAKADIDALRGHDSGAVLRQLVRLGLVAVARRGETDRREVCYGTTPRFLELFGLGSLDDLPRLGDAEQV
jgi:segregation and condensation protein B